MVTPIVTVVHGTFEPEAAWTKEGPLIDAIRARFGEPVVRRLKWSGENTFRARHEAVDLLEKHVVEIERAHSGSPHFLIGHSHGGSVVAYWIKRAPINSERIAGAVFLSTPFVGVQPTRNAVELAGRLAMHGFWLLPLAGFVGGWLLAAVALGLADCLFGWSIDPAVRTRVEAGAALCAAAAGLICFGRIHRVLKVCSSRKGLLLLRIQARRFETCHLPGTRYLFVKTTGDEVLSALGTAQFASLVAHQLQAMALRLTGAIEKRLVYVGPLAGLLVAAWAVTLPETPWALWSASASVGDYLVRLLQLVVNSWGFWLFVGIGIVVQVAPTFVGQIWVLSRLMSQEVV